MVYWGLVPLKHTGTVLLTGPKVSENKSTDTAQTFLSCPYREIREGRISSFLKVLDEAAVLLCVSVGFIRRYRKYEKLCRILLC